MPRFNQTRPAAFAALTVLIEHSHTLLLPEEVHALLKTDTTPQTTQSTLNLLVQRECALYKVEGDAPPSHRARRVYRATPRGWRVYGEGQTAEAWRMTHALDHKRVLQILNARYKPRYKSGEITQVMRALGQCIGKDPKAWTDKEIARCIQWVRGQSRKTQPRYLAYELRTSGLPQLDEGPSPSVVAAQPDIDHIVKDLLDWGRCTRADLAESLKWDTARLGFALRAGVESGSIRRCKREDGRIVFEAVD